MRAGRRTGGREFSRGEEGRKEEVRVRRNKVK